MKVLTINQAIEKKLLNHIGGISLSEDTKIMKSLDRENMENTINNMLKDVLEPSIIVSDDEQEIFCITTEREKNTSKNFFDSPRKSTEKYVYPKIYTKDNTPVLAMGENANNRYSTIPIIQDNKNQDIKEFKLRIKSAKGGIEETETVDKLEKPIELSYEDGLLQLRGQNIEIENNDTIIITKDNFTDYTYSIELEDGRKSDLTFGYNKTPHEYDFCKDIVNRINKIKTEGIGNIEKQSIKCIGYENEKAEAKYYESKPKEVEIVEPEYDKQLKDLMKEDSRLDKEILEAEKVLEQRNNGTIELS